MTGFRIGHGYDVHRIVEGRPLILGGVSVPWDRGLLGHSDADVLTHAVMDALLGAAGLADIGTLFPDTDPRYAGVRSTDLLQEVGRRLAAQDFAVVNIDCTLLAQRPKIAPYKQEMAGGPGQRKSYDGGRAGLYRRQFRYGGPRRRAD